MQGVSAEKVRSVTAAVAGGRAEARDSNSNRSGESFVARLRVADANGDYKMQGDELRLLPSDGHGFSGSSSSCLLLDDSLNLYQGRGYHGENQPAWMQFRPQANSHPARRFGIGTNLCLAPRHRFFSRSHCAGSRRVRCSRFPMAVATALPLGTPIALPHGYQWPATRLMAARSANGTKMADCSGVPARTQHGRIRTPASCTIPSIWPAASTAPSA